MTKDGGSSPIEAHEMLARFILFGGWFRKSNQTAKPDAFMPPPNLRLSVTRHLGLPEAEIWTIGEDVTRTRPAATLYGRADIETAQVRDVSLAVQPSPAPGNPNHADIVDWPNDKPSQKSVAQELAARARFVPAIARD